MATIEEARLILKKFGFDAPRCNERAARTLLALTQLTFESSWDEARNPMMGVRAQSWIG